MPTYLYRGYGEDGAAVRGDIVADGPKQGRQQLAAQGILVETIAAASQSRRSFPVSARSLFYRELAALVEGGMGIVPAIDLLAGMPEMGNAREVLFATRDAVETGTPVAQSLERACPTLTAFERAILRVAERSGRIGETLGTLADFLDQQEEIRGRVQSALLYPVLVAVVGLVLGVLMLGVLLPRAQKLFLEQGIEMPLLTRGAVGLGQWLFGWGWLVLLVLGFVGWLLWRRRAEHPEVVDRIRLRLPLIGRGYRLLIQVRFADALALLLRSGVDAVEGFFLAGEATGSVLCARVVSGQAEQVRHGKELSAAVREVELLSDSLPQWIRTGENTGDLASMLARGALRIRCQWERYTSRCLALLEPALIVAVGAFVLLVVLAVILPMMSMGKGLGL